MVQKLQKQKEIKRAYRENGVFNKVYRSHDFIDNIRNNNVIRLFYDERKVGYMNEMIGNETELIAVDEENKDLDTMVDKLRRNLKVSKIISLVLGVLIAIVLVARLLV